jgi:hypothetical protein
MPRNTFGLHAPRPPRAAKPVAHALMLRPGVDPSAFAAELEHYANTNIRNAPHYGGQMPDIGVLATKGDRCAIVVCLPNLMPPLKAVFREQIADAVPLTKGMFAAGRFESETEKTEAAASRAPIPVERAGAVETPAVVATSAALQLN